MMGYRSEIAFCITVNPKQKKDAQEAHYWEYDKAKFKEMVGFFKLTKFYEIATDTDHNCIKDTEPNLGWEDGVIMFYASQWKWYSEYPLVQAFDQMWESMQDIEGISGYFVRVGEENGDVEEMEFGDEPDNQHFHVYTGLSFDGESYLGKALTDEEEQTEQAQASKEEEPSSSSLTTQP